VGSSKNQWERSGKLLASALDLVVQNNRTPQEWADHLQLFIFGRLYHVTVDKSDPRQRSFNRSEFIEVSPGLQREDYPVCSVGVQSRRFKLVRLGAVFPDRCPTTQELVDLPKGLEEMPDYADTKAFHLANPSEATTDHPIISLCGTISGFGGDKCIALFAADSKGWSLGYSPMNCQWLRHCRLLVAYKN